MANRSWLRRSNPAEPPRAVVDTSGRVVEYHPATGDFDPETLSHNQRRTWDVQESFLQAFGPTGTVLAATEQLGMRRRLIYEWLQRDSLGFRERFRLAEHHFRESLVNMATERLRSASPNSKVGSDILLITMMNAFYPEKFKPQLVMQDSGAKEVLGALKQLTASKHGNDSPTPSAKAETVAPEPDTT